MFVMKSNIFMNHIYCNARCDILKKDRNRVMLLCRRRARYYMDSTKPRCVKVDFDAAEAELFLGKAKCTRVVINVKPRKIEASRRDRDSDQDNQQLSIALIIANALSSIVKYVSYHFGHLECKIIILLSRRISLNLIQVVPFQKHEGQSAGVSCERTSAE